MPFYSISARHLIKSHTRDWRRSYITMESVVTPCHGLKVSWQTDQQVILDGAKSNSALVSSYVPQGTVLGPLLFLVYINDLLSNVNATGRPFADDCLLYRTIKTTDDAVSLQNNLDTLQQWEKDWLMSFNPDKCEVIRITNKKMIIDAKYTIPGQVLHETNSKIPWSYHR